MTLILPGTTLDKRGVSAGPIGKEGGNRGSRRDTGDWEREKRRGRRKGGERKGDADEDTIRKGQLCPPAYSTVKGCIFPSSSSL